MPKCDTSRMDRKNKERDKKGKEYGSSKHIRNKESMMAIRKIRDSNTNKITN